MAISPSAIFHFTSSKASLKGILAENFKIKYCKETIYVGTKHRSIFVPMVSFCDIPLSQVKDHIGRYGSYGIGLTREWAIKNRLNPVLYVEPNSFLAQDYSDAMSFFFKKRQKIDDPIFRSSYMRLFNIAMHMKPYEAPLDRKLDNIDKYRFSDEREWRYVPPVEDWNYASYYPEETFKDDNLRILAEATISRLRLDYEPDDIKYIIIKSEDEIREFVRHLIDVKGDKFTSHGIEKLTTRIITSDQIGLDF